MHKFEQIYHDLKNKIKNGYYPIGSLIPSEPDLAIYYHVSRETVRKAQKRLIDEGFIHKQKGKGAIVLDYEQFSLPISGLVSYKELIHDQNLNSHSHIILNQTTDVPKELIGLYDINDDEKFIHLIRARQIDSEILIIDEEYIRTKYVNEIPSDKALSSIYQYFEEELHLEIGYAIKEFYADLSNELDRQWMNISETDYIMMVASHVFLADTSFFQLTKSRHRIDKFRFKEIAHRRQHR
ncbi:trehalose operon repressor [Facklamia sp. DSM 111018]|uniref:Trehalose operon repressor n=1 Tax=Facklamia lactis TaxID=2749967 RepID=A0ABS0LTE4_9LACT|nr:trehalose operon repressor [Facklamia lactis]MBG9981297.1 trehalose operon repressor [Facklamia lactis]MBG9987227.1 trehalose operon repressor [Facklamia lactis]